MKRTAYQLKRLQQIGIDTWYLRDQHVPKGNPQDQVAELFHMVNVKHPLDGFELHVLADYQAATITEDMQLLNKIIRKVFYCDDEIGCVLANTLKRSALEGHFLLTFGEGAYATVMQLGLQQILLFKLPSLAAIRANPKEKQHAWMILQDATAYWANDQKYH